MLCKETFLTWILIKQMNGASLLRSRLKDYTKNVTVYDKPGIRLKDYTKTSEGLHQNVCRTTPKRLKDYTKTSLYTTSQEFVWRTTPTRLCIRQARNSSEGLHQHVSVYDKPGIRLKDYTNTSLYTTSQGFIRRTTPKRHCIRQARNSSEGLHQHVWRTTPKLQCIRQARDS